MEYEITPCKNCTINKGYGGEYRCSICELSKLRQENERLHKKLKKEQERKTIYNLGHQNCKDSVVITREEYEKLKTDNEVLGVGLERTSTLLVNASKETAEKLLNEILNFINFETFRQGYELKKIKNKLKEIATREGIDIKE